MNSINVILFFQLIWKKKNLNIESNVPQGLLYFDFACVIHTVTTLGRLALYHKQTAVNIW